MWALRKRFGHSECQDTLRVLMVHRPFKGGRLPAAPLRGFNDAAFSFCGIPGVADTPVPTNQRGSERQLPEAPTGDEFAICDAEFAELDGSVVPAFIAEDGGAGIELDEFGEEAAALSAGPFAISLRSKLFTAALALEQHRFVAEDGPLDISDELRRATLAGFSIDGVAGPTTQLAPVGSE